MTLALKYTNARTNYALILFFFLFEFHFLHFLWCKALIKICFDLLNKLYITISQRLTFSLWFHLNYSYGLKRISPYNWQCAFSTSLYSCMLETWPDSNLAYFTFLKKKKKKKQIFWSKILNILIYYNKSKKKIT